MNYNGEFNLGLTDVINSNNKNKIKLDETIN